MKKLAFVFGLLLALTGGFFLTRPSVENVQATTHYKAGTWGTCIVKPGRICGDDAGTQSASCVFTNGSSQDGCTFGGQVVTRNCDITCSKINICHNTSSQYNPWDAIRVDDDGYLNGHPSDFLYTGPVNSQNQQPTSDEWCGNNQPGDVCSNIDGKQTSIPSGKVRGDGMTCVDAKTPVCTIETATNYGGEDHVFTPATEISDNDLCQYTDVCPNISDNQPTLPAGYHFETEDNHQICVKDSTCDEDHDNSDHDDEDDDDDACITPTVSPTVSPTVTPTPTQAPSNGGGDTHGDGKSDGRSDGLSSCPSCTQAPAAVLGASTGPAVLGASTFAGTGTFENTVMDFMLAAGMIVLSLGGLSYAKEKKN